MESYSKKLIRLLRVKMNSPVDSRVSRRFLNPVINNTKGSASRIKYKKQETLDSLNIEITGDDYLKNIDSGGTPPTVNVSDIANWIVTKPLGYRDTKGNVTTNYSSLSASHPTVQEIASRIAKKIETEGIEPTNFISQTLKAHMKNLKIIGPVVTDVKQNIVDILKQAGFDMDGKTVKFS